MLTDGDIPRRKTVTGTNRYREKEGQNRRLHSLRTNQTLVGKSANRVKGMISRTRQLLSNNIQTGATKLRHLPHLALEPSL